ncbi:MAG: hypothetical protein COW10_02020 [Candidatus Omnitrophica bacterium CG12_big_fil_rev_8_21_14_0_65_42_8]|nr:MAG: hypothetical protein COW10_02020 [Candidatus Omnitrophica bacterium CG12_big_fil_rev_8_21_14_0_65_42_8]
MNKTLIKNLKPRTKIYAAILLFGVLYVFIRIMIVQVDRNRPIVSFVSEWGKYGKPVTVEEIKAADIPAYTKFTVTYDSDNLASGFVTADIKDKLKKGQDVYFTDNGGTPCGKISNIGQELDINTGMFPVEVEFNALFSASGSISVVFADTSTLKKALVVPNEILDISGDSYYLWKVDDGRAKRIQVKIASRDSYGAVIAEGIQAGDLIVVSGQSQLKDNDPVNIINREALK